MEWYRISRGESLSKREDESTMEGRRRCVVPLSRWTLEVGPHGRWPTLRAARGDGEWTEGVAGVW